MMFNNKLIGFFEDLHSTFPEERDIKLALETIQGAKKINPKLILDLFKEYVAKPLRDDILHEDEDKVMEEEILVDLNAIGIYGCSIGFSSSNRDKGGCGLSKVHSVTNFLP